jgi:hypothetical protein
MIIPLDLIIHYAVGFPYALKYLVQDLWALTQANAFPLFTLTDWVVILPTLLPAVV